MLYAAALGGMVLGLAYVLRVFGPTEAEVAFCGVVALALGALLLAVAGAVWARHAPLSAASVAMVVAMCAALALLQVLPVLLWVLFHGQPISDGSPPSAFRAHWAFSLPHVLVALLALGAAFRLLRAQRALAPRSFAEVLAQRWPSDPTPPA